MIWLIKILGVVLCVPFFTLLERKILSYSQNRKGPKKVRILGLLQPVSDGVKLIIKSSGSPFSANQYLFYIFPVVRFILTLRFIFFFPRKFNSYLFHLGIIGIICISSLGIYTLLGRGWRSKSKYSLLGSLRGAAQVISYEIKLVFLIIFPCTLLMKYKLKRFYSKYLFFVGFFFLVILWCFMVLCETNRAPFDFAEGERELVSGFNTEYSSLLFTFLFLREYGKIIFFSWFLRCLFSIFRLWFLSYFLFFFFLFMFLWCRATFPRFRYDFLMIFSWCVSLPIVTIIFWLAFCF